MKSRPPLFEFALLLIPPSVAFLIIKTFWHDYYIAISVSYLALLVVLQFVAIEKFLLFRDLQALWQEQSKTDLQLTLQPAQFTPPMVKVAPCVILSDANLSNVAKLRYLLIETGAFIPTLKDEFRKNLFLNLLIFGVLLIITPPPQQSPNQPSNMPVTQQTTAASGSNQNVPTSISATEPSLLESVHLQGRLVMSFFAVAIQLVWIGRVLFHYRQKNADIYFQAKATQSA